jgi:hypothetical protein
VAQSKHKDPLKPIVAISILGSAYYLYALATEHRNDPFTVITLVLVLAFVYVYFRRPEYAGDFLFYSALPVYPLYFLAIALRLIAPPAFVATYYLLGVAYVAVIVVFWNDKKKYDTYLQLLRGGPPQQEESSDVKPRGLEKHKPVIGGSPRAKQRAKADPNIPALVLLIAATIGALYVGYRMNLENPSTSSSASNQIGKAPSDSVIEISIQRGNDYLLYILLSSDRTVNRQGAVNAALTYERDGTPATVYIGPSREPILDDMFRSFPSFINTLHGESAIRGRGTTILLKITVRTGPNTHSETYKYGSASLGPPTTVRHFVIQAVRYTDSWVEGVKRSRGR